MNKKSLKISVAVAISAVAALMGGAPANAQDLTGAGSTFLNPIMQNWIAEYGKSTGVKINYQSSGSGGGISALINKTVNFAGSDAPMNAQELAEAKGPVLHLPVVIGTECIAYNVPGIPTGLHFTGEVVADIFMGKIAFWDDAQIKALNPTARLPHERMFVAHRSDGSGTTYILTDYLSKVSPEWKTQVGVGKTVKWPVGLGGKGNEGVAGLVRTHPNSIGYVELAYAVQNKIAYASLRNARGKFIEPGVESGSLAADGVKIPADMRVSITNTSEPNGYPITGFSWIIVYNDATNGPAIKKFLQWITTSGQALCKPLQYAPVPASLQKREAMMINSIK